METKIIYTAEDVGCYANGAGGHNHVREVLADLVGALGHSALESELHGEMTDDASEEDEALDLLNENTDQDKNGPVVWEFVDGDLMLSRLVSENS